MKHPSFSPKGAMPRAAILAAALALSFFLPGSLGAQKVAVASDSLDAVPNADMEGIVSRAASIRLERMGEESLILEGLDSAALRDPAALLRRAEAKAARSLLVAEYSEKANSLELRLAWFDGVEGKWLAEVSKGCPKNMRLDESIFAAVDELLDRVEAQNPPGLKVPADAKTTPGNALDQGAKEPAGAEKSVSQAATESPEPGAAGNEEPRSGQASEATVPTEAAREEGKSPAPQNPSASLDGPPKTESGLELGFGLGPYVAAGSLAEYFKAAGGLDARVAWVFAFPRWALHLGLDASGTLFGAKGPLESATGLLTPLALDLRFASVEGGLRPFARAYGGAALLYLRTAIYGDRHAFLPFFGAGFGLQWVLRSGLSLGPDLSYSVAVDGQDLIMGLTPAIELSIPLGRRP